MTGTGQGRAAQPERTRLAWRRTVLTGTVVALLALQQAFTAEQWWARAAGSAWVMLVWLALVTVAHRRITALHRTSPPDAPWPALPVIATGMTLGLAAAALAQLTM